MLRWSDRLVGRLLARAALAALLPLCLVLASPLGRAATPTLAASDLTGALLVVADFPDGWKDGGPLDGDAGPRRSCLDGFPLATAPAERAGRWFMSADARLMVSHEVRRYDGGSAASAMAPLPPGFQDCSWEEANDGSGAMLLRIERADAPPVGDAAVALHLHTRWGTASMDSDIVLIRRADRISILTVTAADGTTTGIDPEFVRRLTERATARLDATASLQ